MLNIGPPNPSYTHTWDVHLVQNYLDCLGKTKLLPLKLLSIKLAILFALSWPERAASLAKLDLRLCCVSPQGDFLHTCVSEKAKLSTSTTSSLFCIFSTHERLCPVGTLRPYLQAARNIHLVFLSSKPDPLFLMSNYTILSLRTLLADGCAWS